MEFRATCDCLDLIQGWIDNQAIAGDNAHFFMRTMIAFPWISQGKAYLSKFGLNCAG